jgi:hypothetical protein
MAIQNFFSIMQHYTTMQFKVVFGTKKKKNNKVKIREIIKK